MLKFLFALIPLLAFANPKQEQKERMKSDLDVIRSAFEVGYAPREWKGKQIGWDLDSEIAKTKDKIQQMKEPSVKGYQFLLRDFFNSMRDYHVGVFFFSTEKASLPFQVKGANGRYFISSIDTERLSPNVFPVNCGDELVTFDGQPADKVVKELKNRYLRGAADATDLSFAEYFLTLRSAKVGHIVPKGPISIGIRHKNAAKVSTYQLIWNYTPEQITNGFGVEEKSSPKFPLLQLKMISPLYEELFADKSEKPPLLGYRKSLLPPLGRIWWQSEEESTFDAYIFETAEKKLIGYIRIPDYVGMDDEVKEFAEIISKFEERTDALVIDQLDNPGGYIFYCYALLSMLTDSPLVTPLHRMAITQEDVFHAVEAIPDLEAITSDEEARQFFGNTLFGMPVTYQMTRFILDYFHFIISEWNAGRKLTSPYFLGYLNHINPHPDARYSKPILVLINGLDISCGDFFPAILQDNRRATLLGARTAGAGGYVRTASFPNRFGVHAFRYTGSIAERVDKNPIENLGVTPDISYNIKEKDLQDQYSSFAKEIEKSLQKLF